MEHEESVTALYPRTHLYWKITHTHTQNPVKPDDMSITRPGGTTSFKFSDS